MGVYKSDPPNIIEKLSQGEQENLWHDHTASAFGSV